MELDAASASCRSLISTRPSCSAAAKGFVFPGEREGLAFSILPKLWRRIFRKSALPTLTPHVLRHSFATMANELGYTEATISAMLGHSRGTIPSRYVHNVDAALVNAANAVAGHIAGLMGLASASMMSDGQLELDLMPPVSEKHQQPRRETSQVAHPEAREGALAESISEAGALNKALAQLREESAPTDP